MVYGLIGVTIAWVIIAYKGYWHPSERQPSAAGAFWESVMILCMGYLCGKILGPALINTIFSVGVQQ